MSLEDSGLEQSNFTHLRESLVEAELAQGFFDAIGRLPVVELNVRHGGVEPLVEASSSCNAGQRSFPGVGTSDAVRIFIVGAGVPPGRYPSQAFRPAMWHAPLRAVADESK
jgi:hypothetical protein